MTPFTKTLRILVALNEGVEKDKGVVHVVLLPLFFKVGSFGLGRGEVMNHYEIKKLKDLTGHIAAGVVKQGWSFKSYLSDMPQGGHADVLIALADQLPPQHTQNSTRRMCHRGG